MSVRKINEVCSGGNWVAFVLKLQNLRSVESRVEPAKVAMFLRVHL